MLFFFVVNVDNSNIICDSASTWTVMMFDSYSEPSSWGRFQPLYEVKRSSKQISEIITFTPEMLSPLGWNCRCLIVQSDLSRCLEEVSKKEETKSHFQATKNSLYFSSVSTISGVLRSLSFVPNWNNMDTWAGEWQTHQQARLYLGCESWSLDLEPISRPAKQDG